MIKSTTKQVINNIFNTSSILTLPWNCYAVKLNIIDWYSSTSIPAISILILFANFWHIILTIYIRTNIYEHVKASYTCSSLLNAPELSKLDEFWATDSDSSYSLPNSSSSSPPVLSLVVVSPPVLSPPVLSPVVLLPASVSSNSSSSLRFLLDPSDSERLHLLFNCMCQKKK